MPGVFKPVYGYDGNPIGDPFNGGPVMMETPCPYADGANSYELFGSTGLRSISKDVFHIDSPAGYQALGEGVICLLNSGGHRSVKVNLEVTGYAGPTERFARAAVWTEVRTGGNYGPPFAYSVLPGDGQPSFPPGGGDPGDNMATDADPPVVEITLPAWYRYRLRFRVYAAQGVLSTEDDEAGAVKLTFSYMV